MWCEIFKRVPLYFIITHDLSYKETIQYVDKSIIYADGF